MADVVGQLDHKVKDIETVMETITQISSQPQYLRLTQVLRLPAGERNKEKDSLFVVAEDAGARGQRRHEASAR